MNDYPTKGSNMEFNVTKNYSIKYEPVSKLAFSKWVRLRLKEYNNEYGTELSIDDLADKVGIGHAMFKKILNKNKPTKKRDCIIAICVALRLISGDIQEALELYQMRPNLEDTDPRDKFITALVNGAKDRELTIKELNNQLLQRGFNSLDIHNKRNKSKSLSTNSIESRFCDLKLSVTTHIIRRHYYGEYNYSLCTTYDPSGCIITGNLSLYDNEKKRFVTLTSDSEGFRKALTLKLENNPKAKKNRKALVGDYSESIEDIEHYRCLFSELENAIELEKKNQLQILNDTKNYRVRSSAKLIDDSIAIFAESFNYKFPELNEYYFMTRTNGKYRLYVYEHSSFMAWYLSKDKYKTYFGSKTPVPKVTYESLEELDNYYEETLYLGLDEDHVRSKMRLDAFKELMMIVDGLYHDIKNRVALKQNPELLLFNASEVLFHYNLDSDFECDDSNISGLFCDYSNSKEYSLPDGTVVTITLADIIRAFEFGFPDFNEICRVKAKYGSIEALLD